MLGSSDLLPWRPLSSLLHNIGTPSTVFFPVFYHILHEGLWGCCLGNWSRALSKAASGKSSVVTSEGLSHILCWWSFWWLSGVSFQLLYNCLEQCSLSTLMVKSPSLGVVNKTTSLGCVKTVIHSIISSVLEVETCTQLTKEVILIFKSFSSKNFIPEGCLNDRGNTKYRKSYVISLLKVVSTSCACIMDTFAWHSQALYTLY